MNSAKIASLVIVMLVLPAVAWSQKPEPDRISGKIRWVFDYEQAKQLSQDTGKPMFVVFRCER